MSLPIRIAIDTRDLQKAFSGTHTYLQSLIHAWQNIESKTFEYILLGSQSKVYTGKQKWKKAAEHLQFLVWKQIRLPLLVKKNQCSILFCSDYFLPFFHPGFKTVVVFHDAFFFEYPEHYNAIWLQLFKKLAIPAAFKASAIIVPSAYSKNKIQYFTGFPAHKLNVVYEAPGQKPETIPDHPTLPNPYFLHVGTLNKNKNLVRALHAFKNLIITNPTSAVCLVLAGKSSPHSALSDEKNILDTITALQLESRVMLTGFLDAPGLAKIYTNALAYLFPSYNEGFGIPVLEAFQYGIPLLAANNTCLPEIAADAALYFNPFHENEITDAMQQILSDAGIRKQLIEKGFKRLENFSWHQSALQINAIFNAV